MKEHSNNSNINSSSEIVFATGTSTLTLPSSSGALLTTSNDGNLTWSSQMNIDSVTTKSLTVEGGVSYLEFSNNDAYIKMSDCKEGQVLTANKKGELRCKDPKTEVVTMQFGNNLPACFEGKILIYGKDFKPECKEIPQMSLGMTNWILIVAVIILIGRVSLKTYFSIVKFFKRKAEAAAQEIEKEWKEAE